MPPNPANGRASLAPAPIGNRRAEKHGGYVTSFTPTEGPRSPNRGQGSAGLLRLTPTRSRRRSAFLAGQVWRRDRLLADLKRHGVIRGRADRGRVAPAAVALTELERAIVRNLGELALLPKAAADLGLTLARAKNAAGDRFDPSRLTGPERVEFERLLEKGIRMANPIDAARAALDREWWKRCTNSELGAWRSWEELGERAGAGWYADPQDAARPPDERPAPPPA